MNQNAQITNIESLQQLLELEPNHASAHHHLGILFLQQKNFTKAIEHLQQASKLQPNHATLLNNLGVAFAQTNNLVAAKEIFLKSFAIDPTLFDTCNNLGNIFLAEKQYQLAVDYFQQAIALNPHLMEAYNNIATAYMKQNNQKQALDFIQKALELAPNSPLPLNNYAKLLKHTGELDKSIKVFKQVIQQYPDHFDAMNHLADIYRTKEKYDQAKNLLNQVLNHEPDNYDANYFKGLIHYAHSEYELGEQFLTKAANPAKPSMYELGMLGHCQLAQGKWEAWQATQSAADKLLYSEHSYEPVNPFLGQSLFEDLDKFHKVAKRWGEVYEKKRVHEPFPRIDYKHKKLKIGYISPNFTHHPVGVQLEGLFGLHDRDSFEIYALPNRTYKTPLYYQLCNGCDHVKELMNYSYDEAAEIIRGLEIDILVDLAASTDGDNYQTLARQPAPIQCHMIGATGTLGTSFIQYIITSALIYQSEYLPFYSETPVCLPETEIARAKFEIPDRPIYRADWGLPEDAIVFLAHHTYYRIDPEVFQAWMKILKGVDNSVLWIKTTHDGFFTRLQQEAKNSGVDPKRLIALKEPMLNYKWQHRLADLFLDTFRFSSGTCSFFCAWAGLPMLTVAGDTPQARVGASFCFASGLESQIVTNKDEYVQKAIELGNQPHILKEMHQALLSLRETSPLFDQSRYISYLESAYRLMYQDFQQGSPASCIFVE